MASLKHYVDSPLFTDGTELSATELNILLNNAEAVKFASIRPAYVHQIGRILQVQNNGWFWQGGFQYRVGLTTARFIIWTKQVSGEGEHAIVIYFDNTEVYRYDAASTGLNVGGYTTVDIAINASGYDDFQIISVKMIAEPQAGGGADDATKGQQWCLDAYTFPYTGLVDVGTWPGSSSFGTLTDTRLNQMSNGLDFLANRVASIPNPLQMNLIKFMGTSNPKYPKFRYFKVRFANENKRLKTSVYYMCKHISARIRLTIGSAVWNFGPYTTNQNVTVNIDVDGIAAGLSFDTDYFASLEEVVDTPGDNSDGHGGFIFSRVSSGPIQLYANAYTILSSATPFESLESITFTVLQNMINSVVDIIAAANTRIAAQTAVFNRGPMFRGRYGIKQDQDEYWATTFLAGTYREGDVLWVKGQDLSIGYGPVAIDVKSDAKPNDIWEYKFLYNEQLLDGDKISQNYFHLDQFDGLHPGMLYYITGKDIHYAAEHLR